jgi:NAD(P)-dependent dehydrogenase (short-subunit alcohol dehydrogenase family)
VSGRRELAGQVAGERRRAVTLKPAGLGADCRRLLNQGFSSSAIAYNLTWHGSRPKPSEEAGLRLITDDVVDHDDGWLALLGVSMGASVGLTKALAMERAADGITGNAVAPTFADAATPHSMLADDAFQPAYSDGFLSVPSAQRKRSPRPWRISSTQQLDGHRSRVVRRQRLGRVATGISSGDGNGRSSCR